MLRVCRTCLQKISNINFVSLSDGIQSLQIKSELTLCIPEMVLDSVAESVMCMSCIGALHSAYDFKRLCLQTEERIQNYIQNVHFSVDPVDLTNVCNLQSNSEGATSEANLKLNPSEMERIHDKASDSEQNSRMHEFENEC